MSKFIKSQFITIAILALITGVIVQALFTTQSVSDQTGKASSIDIPADPDGRHTVVSLRRDRDRYWNLVSLRTGKSGNLFTHIRIDCDSHKYQLLHEARTLEAMQDQRRLSVGWNDLVDRSINYYKASHVCSSPGE